MMCIVTVLFKFVLFVSVEAAGVDQVAAVEGVQQQGPGQPAGTLLQGS